MPLSEERYFLHLLAAVLTSIERLILPRRARQEDRRPAGNSTAGSLKAHLFKSGSKIQVPLRKPETRAKYR